MLIARSAEKSRIAWLTSRSAAPARRCCLTEPSLQAASHQERVYNARGARDVR